MSIAYDLLGTTMKDLERASLTLLDKAIEYYQPARVYALFSGGGDSTASTLLASRHPAFSGVLHLDTETGVPETQAHVVEVCASFGWDLVVEPPRTTSYDTLVMRLGFPGRGKHGAAYWHLKDRALKRLTAQKRAGKTVLLVAGARTEESVRRMGTAKILTEGKGDNRVWLNPILHWPKDATRDYAALHDVPESPVSKRLGMSGECLCGCYARPGELSLIRMHFPHVAERIEWRQEKAKAAGVWHHWGVQAPKKFDRWPNMPEIDQFMCTDCVRRIA